MPEERCRICGSANTKLCGTINENYQGSLKSETPHNQKRKFCKRCSKKVYPPKSLTRTLIGATKVQKSTMKFEVKIDPEWQAQVLESLNHSNKIHSNNNLSKKKEEEEEGKVVVSKEEYDGLVKFKETTVSYLHNLPLTSPLRRPMINFFLHSLPLSNHEASNLFDFSIDTIKRSRNMESNFALSLKSKPHTRIVIDPESVVHAKKFLDDNVPVSSGRDYRIQRVPDQSLYESYFNDAIQNRRKPLSKTYFIYSLLASEKIHKSKDETICDTCKSYSEVEFLKNRTEEEEEKYQKGKKHQETWISQSKNYLKTKDLLLIGNLEDSLLIVQDFTQVQAQSTFFQNLIICIYEFGGEGKELKRYYHHFMGQESSTKNDVWFVISVWKKMFESDFFKGIKNIYIYSDGGPKHFKVTSCISFFCALQQKYLVNISYNFYESHHGHSICDGAAHFKGYLNRYQRIHQIPLKKPKDMVDLACHIHNHLGHLAPINELAIDTFPTFHGIRSYYKFTFSNNLIYAYSRSEDKVHTKEYKRKEFFFFEFESFSF